LSTYPKWSYSQWLLRMIDALKESDAPVLDPDLQGFTLCGEILAKGVLLESEAFARGRDKFKL
jgi:hypothetical protein